MWEEPPKCKPTLNAWQPGLSVFITDCPSFCVFAADAINNAAGFGFRGYDKNGVSHWDLISNLRILHIEVGTIFCKNLWELKNVAIWPSLIQYLLVMRWNRGHKTEVVTAKLSVCRGSWHSELLQRLPWAWHNSFTCATVQPWHQKLISGMNAGWIHLGLSCV